MSQNSKQAALTNYFIQIPGSTINGPVSKQISKSDDGKICPYGCSTKKMNKGSLQHHIASKHINVKGPKSKPKPNENVEIFENCNGLAALADYGSIEVYSGPHNFSIPPTVIRLVDVDPPTQRLGSQMGKIKKPRRGYNVKFVQETISTYFHVFSYFLIETSLTSKLNMSKWR